MTSLRAQLRLRHPIVQAPLGGGFIPPEMVADVVRAGALGSIAAAYLSPSEIDAQVATVRARTDGAFSINLFAPQPQTTATDGELEAAQSVLDPMRAELGIPQHPRVVAKARDFDAQFESVLRAAPALFSFTLGMPTREHLRAARERNILVMGTATSVDEGEALEALGVDVVCAQGAEAGGHRGTFLGQGAEADGTGVDDRDVEHALVGTIALVPLLVSRLKIPVVAAGGIVDGRGIAAALALGAELVQLGTAFLACPEANVPSAYRDALRGGRRTVVTRAYSGRPGRSIDNRLTRAFSKQKTPAFPHHQALTADVRAAASKSGRADLMQLWAGQGAPLVRPLSAGELIQTLARETEAALGAAKAAWER